MKKKLVTRVSALIFAMMLLFANCMSIMAADVSDDDGRWETIKGDGYNIYCSTKTDAGYLASIEIESPTSTTDLATKAATAMADIHVLNGSALHVYWLPDDATVSTAVLSTLKTKGMRLTTYSHTNNAYFDIPVVTSAAADFSPTLTPQSSVAEVSAKLSAGGVTSNVTQFTISGTGSLPGANAYVSYQAATDLIAIPDGAYYVEGYAYYYDASRDLFEYVGEAYYNQYSYTGADGTTTSNAYVDVYGASKKGTYVVTKDSLPDSITTGKTVTVDTSKITTTAALATAITDAIASADAGTIVKCAVPSGTTVSKSVMEAAKAKGVRLTLESSAGTYVSWAFGVIANAVDFDPTVNVGSTIAAVETKLGSVTLPTTLKYTEVAFAYDGTLPAEAEVTLDLSSCGQFTDGSTVYLYYYNTTTNLFEKIDSSAYKSGFATFTMTHCSDYIVTNEELTGALIEDVSPKTGDAANIITYVVLLTLGAAAIAAVVVRRRKDA